MGEARVELRDESSLPIPGYSLADCDPIDLNELRRDVTWNGKGDLGSFSGRPIRLRVKMHSAKLYAFQFAEREE
jgi:hypothetical protein